MTTAGAVTKISAAIGGNYRVWSEVTTAGAVVKVGRWGGSRALCSLVPIADDVRPAWVAAFIASVKAGNVENPGPHVVRL